MQAIHTTLAGLDCRIIDAETKGKPEQAVVLLHGFGAPGTDLVPLAGEILAHEPRLHAHTRFYFPAAPLELTSWGLYDARAWWLVDVGRYEEALRRGDLANLRADVPAGLAEARRAVMRLLAEIEADSHVPMSRIALGGFSQGAMLATDVALHADEPPAALLAFSGTLLAEKEWARFAQRRRGLPTLVAHGRFDPLLPFQGAEWLRDFLTEAGLDVRWVPFDGEHTIDRDVLRQAARMLADHYG